MLVCSFFFYEFLEMSYHLNNDG